MQRLVIDVITGEKSLVDVAPEEIAEEAARKAADWDRLTYAEKRMAEYPPLVDYIDGVVKGDQAQIDAYISACLAVKAKYPKP
jgi:hypothetical protein